MVDLEFQQQVLLRLADINLYLARIDDMLMGLVVMGITVIIIVILWKFYSFFTD